MKLNTRYLLTTLSFGILVLSQSSFAHEHKPWDAAQFDKCAPSAPQGTSASQKTMHKYAKSLKGDDKKTFWECMKPKANTEGPADTSGSAPKAE
jgi:hypothetical protein